jgi:CheY-like chemotaxis protein
MVPGVLRALKVLIPKGRTPEPLELSDSLRLTDKTKVPQTLLLADDSVTIQRVIELTFADESINVVAVGDGDQAIERIDADPPDIVLVDVGMPGRNGYEVAQHIKQSPRLKHIPVLLLTGAFEPVDQAKAAAAGCDGVLQKPFEPQLVIARVKELLGRGGESSAPAAPAVEKPAPAVISESSSIWGLPAAEPKATLPPAEQKATLPPAEQRAHLDDYFDQLDSAFQKLGGNAPAEELKAPAAASPVAKIIDWFGGTPAPSAQEPDLPLSITPPQREREFDHTANAPAPSMPGFGTEPVPDTERFVSEPAPEKPARFVSEPAPETPARFVAEPAPETPARFVAELAPETPARFVAEPAPETAARFVAEPAPETATRFVSEPAAETPARFVSEPAWETTARFVPEPAPETPARFVPEPASEARSVSEPVRKPTMTATRDEPPSPSATLPPMADAFAAILDAEQHERMPALGTAWQAPLPAPSNGGGPPSEEAIDEITRRVLARLSDRVVREAVADAISSIAERLVRDEIERIKATIK